MSRDEWLARLHSADEVACDIEIASSEEILCVGFADSPTEAAVFRCHEGVPDDVAALLEAESPRKIFANGQFDCYFLRTRCSVEVGGYSEDTQLAWHSCYPELAGKSEWRDSKVTRKGLKFLISLFLDVPWWKDYETDAAGMYRLNGLDCCYTYELMTEHLRPLIAELGAEETYRFELSLQPMLIAAWERGLKIDEERRLELYGKLDERVERLLDEVAAEVEDAVAAAIEEERIEKPHLYEDVWTCPCCRNGRIKRDHCVDCAGIEGSGANGAILRGDLLEWAIRAGHEGTAKLKKDELADLVPPCEVCGGEGQRVSFAFNANSNDQLIDLAYNVWRLPKRYHEKRLSMREEKLKAHIAYLKAKGDERAQTLEKVLWIGRCAKMRGDLKGFQPAADGRLRTVMNASGTETGRLSHGGSFLEASRNLGNIANKRAALDPLFDLRSVFCASEGCDLIEADGSQIEARIAAYLAEDKLAMQQYEEGIDRYRFFASKFYEIPMKDISAAQRHVGKTAVLALQYGVAWKTFMEHVNEDEELTGAAITAKEAKRAVALFHEIYPGYRRWHSAVWREAQRNGGYLVNAFGRRRDFFGRTDSRSAEESVRREMVAFLPQSTAVDHMNRRILAAFEALDPRSPQGSGDWRFLLQVHDSGMGETEKWKTRSVAAKLKRILEQPLALPNNRIIEIPVEVKAGERWSQMKEVELP